MAAKRFVIIGDGAAGTTAAQYLRAADPHATITILSDDPHPAYFRAALTNYLLGALRTEQIFAVPPSFYDELRIHRAQARVATIEPDTSSVVLAQGPRVPYDALLIATGSRCRPPFFEGWWHPGIMTMRTLQDVNRVIDLVKQRALRSAVLVGGGPLALEWAHGLSARGASVTIVVRETRFLQNAIDSVASDLLLARLRRGGVDVRMSEEVAAALPGPDGRIQSVALRSGGRLPCDLLAVAIGVICNSELVAKSGIKVAQNGGIEVDQKMRTNVPNIFAAGDVAAFEGRLLQLWEPARTQGRIAAFNMLGSAAHYTPGAHYMATRLYDLDCASIGDVGAGTEELVDFPQGTGKISYRKLAITDHRLVGALMFGEREAHVRRLGRSFKRLIDAKLDVRPIKDDLLDPAFDLPAWLNRHVLVHKPQFQANAALSAGSVRSMRAASPLDVSAVGPGWDPSMTAQPTPEQLLALAQAAATDDRSVFPDSLRHAGGEPLSVFDAGPPPTVTIEARSDALRDPRPEKRVVIGGASGKSSAILGRDPESAIVIDDRLVSSSHAEITITGQSVYVRDLGSSNGTWVSGVVVTTPRRLRTGDNIRVGLTELGVKIDGTAEAGAPSQWNWVGRSSGVPNIAPAPVGSPQPYLEIRSGRSVGLSFALTKTPVTIGRDVHATIHLSDEWIDVKHAALRKVDTGWEIADAKSHGVTKQNGHVLPAEVWLPLAAGDVIEVGYVQMAYVVKDAAATNEAPEGILSPVAGEPARDDEPVPATVADAAPPVPAPLDKRQPLQAVAMQASGWEHLRSFVATPSAPNAGSSEPARMTPPPPPDPRPRHAAIAMLARQSDAPQADPHPSPRDAAMPARESAPPQTIVDRPLSPRHVAIAMPSTPPTTDAAPDATKIPPAPAADQRISDAPSRPRHAAIAMPMRASTPAPPLAGPRARLAQPNGMKMDLTHDVTTIGSLMGHGMFVVSDPLVAPRHAEITRRPDGFYARDLGTRMGTRCRGQAIGSEPRKLVHGDVLELGAATQVLFEELGAR